MTENQNTVTDSDATDLVEEFEYEQGEGQPSDEQIAADAAAAEAEAAIPVPADEPKASDKGIRDKAQFEKGTWQYDLVDSATLTDRSESAKRRATNLLWRATTAAVTDFLTKSDVDVHGENLYAEVVEIMGKARRGDAFKIKSVALAVANHGLDLDQFSSLSPASREAKRLLEADSVAEKEAGEDSAAESVIEEIVASAPSSTTTVDGAAAILLSKGIDGAVVAILDALNGASGENNVAAHRAFLRATSTEINHRTAPAPKAEPTEKSVAVADKAPTPARAKAAPAKDKKAAPAKATPAKKATPSAAATRQSDPTKRALPAKRATPAAPVKRPS